MNDLKFYRGKCIDLPVARCDGYFKCIYGSQNVSYPASRSPFDLPRRSIEGTSARRVKCEHAAPC